MLCYLEIKLWSPFLGAQLLGYFRETSGRMAEVEGN